MDLKDLGKNHKLAVEFTNELQDLLGATILKMKEVTIKYEKQGLPTFYLAPLNLLVVKHFYQAFEESLPNAAKLLDGFEKFKGSPLMNKLVDELFPKNNKDKDSFNQT